MNKKLLLYIPSMFLLLQGFFTSNVYAKNKLEMQVATGYGFSESSKTTSASNFNVAEFSGALNPLFFINILDNFFLKGTYSKTNDFGYNFYSASLMYRIINYPSLTLYAGYDIFSRYELSDDLAINFEENVAFVSSKSYNANSFFITLDVRAYKSYFVFFEYRNANIKNANDLTLNSYIVGLKYKFNIANANKIKNF